MLEEAGFADAVRTGPGFQLKTVRRFRGAAAIPSLISPINFRRPRHGLPSPPRRVRQILIEEAAKQGVEVRFGHGVTAFDNSGDLPA
ncbi:putative dehydrogenase [Neisseria gonorrhoeae]|uniref:Putative dehydrogenase n=1 Tax=Neisseria gonorrhoeae TaxID=485 RepID=A0A378W2I0_NEIGO|nr:putative dehydrogenase [Neisseria gonorrhoeae]